MLDAAEKRIYLNGRAGQMMYDMTFHHLRHTDATILLASGTYINDVSKRLGRATPAITFDINAHCLPPGNDELVQKVDEPLK